MSARPQLSLALVNFAPEDPGDGWRHLIARAVAADRAGFDAVVVSDHVVFGEDLEAYGDPALGGIEGGRQPTSPDGHWLEPMMLLAMIAGVTEHVRLSTGILLAALRRPAVLAKEAATLDVLSGGRLELGVGVGWQREEYDAAGLDFAARGRLLDHTLEVCRALWRDRCVDYAADELTFTGVHAMPKPVQAGGVPIWVSGTLNDAVVRRLVRFGSGWIPWGPHIATLGESIARMRAAVADAGRSPDEIGVVGSLAAGGDPDELDIGRLLAEVEPLLAAGVSDVRLFVPLPRQPAALDDLLGSLVASYDAITGRPARPTPS